MAPTVTIDKLLQGRRAVVTGAGTGIGAALAEGLAAHGARVVAVGRTARTLEDTVAKVRAAGGAAEACVLDVSDAAACSQAADRLAEDGSGDVSILVNAAGVIRMAGVDSPDLQQAWREMLDINLSGPFQLTMALLPQLRRTRGSVINIGSMAAYIYTGNTPGYSASKGGVHMLTVALARELGKDGIRVNTVAPGAIATAMSPLDDERKMAAIGRRTALGRAGQPDELVGPVVFLASAMSSYVTGATLLADGGYLTA